MSLYRRLRPLYHYSPQDRMQIMQAEIVAPLDVTRRAVDRLLQMDANQTALLIRGRFDELIDILHESMARLETLVAEGNERARVSSISDRDLHVYRHDLLTPLGNIRNVARLLISIDVPDLPPDFTQVTHNLDAASRDVLDVIDALTASQERTE
ncbi:MAG: histidine kinase [Roseiflexus sp.]